MTFGGRWSFALGSNAFSRKHTRVKIGRDQVRPSPARRRNFDLRFDHAPVADLTPAAPSTRTSTTTRPAIVKKLLPERRLQLQTPIDDVTVGRPAREIRPIADVRPYTLNIFDICI